MTRCGLATTSGSPTARTVDREVRQLTNSAMTTVVRGTGAALVAGNAVLAVALLDDGLAYVKEGDKIYASAKGNPQGADGMAAIPDGPAETGGIRVGKRAARAMLAARENDGRDGPRQPVFGTEPGVWRPTPPAFAVTDSTWIGGVQPFLIPSTCAFSDVARRTTARITALRPGQSPPPVRIPMRTPINKSIWFSDQRSENSFALA